MQTFKCRPCRLAVTAEQVLQFPEFLSPLPAGAALGTRRTSDYPWRIANIRSHFFPPHATICLSAADCYFWIAYDYTSARLISIK
jgi:hypothetical protein